MRAYWQETGPDCLTWRERQAYLRDVLESYGLEMHDCLIKDVGWSQGWQIAVGFRKLLEAREWWRRERDDDDDRLPLEPQL